MTDCNADSAHCKDLEFIEKRIKQGEEEMDNHITIFTFRNVSSDS
jgi:hypothetical protein